MNVPSSKQINECSGSCVLRTRAPLRLLAGGCLTPRTAPAHGYYCPVTIFDGPSGCRDLVISQEVPHSL